MSRPCFAGFEPALEFVPTSRIVPTTERWSQNFGPVFKVDRMTNETIQNEQEKELFA